MSVQLLDVLTGLDIQAPASVRGLRISGLCYDSRKAGPGDLFFALSGAHSDGGDHAREAVSRGAVAVVSGMPVSDCPVPVVRASDPRRAMAWMAAAFHGHPARTMKTVAVTGTNGKTTTTFLVRHILNQELHRTGLVGTVKYLIADREIAAERTTPESVDLQALLAEMRDAGCRAMAMEASSHALVQKRCEGIPFDAAVFTNLTQDHLDYHKTMEAYFEAKYLLFEGLAAQTSKKGRAIVNLDDRHGSLLVNRLARSPVQVTTFGLGVQSDFRATDTRFDPQGSSFHLEARGRTYLVRLPLIGAFNVSNALAALAACAALGIEVRAAVKALAGAPQVPGRLERVSIRRNFQVFVDYAHTEDALQNVLTTLRGLPSDRLLVVLGCGGDRDRSKRPLMAAAATRLADFSILTSDNPRSEDPLQILADMTPGVRPGAAYEILPDRAAAIRRAINLAGPGDIVLIAGKGHENYQEGTSGRVPFDDGLIARRVIEERRVELGGGGAA